MPAVSTYGLTGDANIDGLLGNRKWATVDITFSFPTASSFYGASYGYGEPQNSFASLNMAQQAAARSALSSYAAVSNLHFVEVAETSAQEGVLRFALSDAPSTAWAYFPTTASEGGDVWLNRSRGYYNSPVKGNYAFDTFLHEIGHSIGLEHPHEHFVMPVGRDSMEYTVMSYRSFIGASTASGYTNEQWGYAQSLMMYDIAAVQHLYGANYSTNSGDTIYSWSATTGEMSINGIAQGAPGGNRIFQTIWDGGGVDTYDFSNYATALSVNLQPGQWTLVSAQQLAKLHYDGSRLAAGNIANSLLSNNDARSLIENAKGGSSDDVITGNSAANTLWGNAGNDKIYGGVGDDVLVGGSGNDWLDGGSGTDVAVYGGALRSYRAEQFPGGAIRLTDLRDNPLDGKDTVSSVEIFKFSDVVSNVEQLWADVAAAPGAVMWRNMMTGEVAVSEMVDGRTAGTRSVVSVADGWQIGGVGDFDKDGTDDIIWRNTQTGNVSVWDMTEGRMANATILTTVSNGWQIGGVGDFNNDGTNDVIWHNTQTGWVSVWQMSNGRMASATILTTVADGWQIGGVGDFDNDGTDDVIWHNRQTGWVSVWDMAGGQMANATILATVSQGWRVGGVGDFDKDGTDDVVWRNTQTGNVSVWDMAGGRMANATILTTVSNGWQIGGVGDFDNDGTSDVIWRDANTGSISIWDMADGRMANATTLTTVADGWQIAGVGNLFGADLFV